MRDYFESATKGNLAERLKFLLVIILTLFLIIALELAFIQILRGQYYRKVSRENSLRFIREGALRGRILDRYKRPIVENKVILNLSAIPEEMVKTKDLITPLSSIISMSEKELQSRLKMKSVSPFDGLLIKEGLTLDEAVKISEQNFKIPGIHIKEESCRSYPQHRLGSHVIGYPGYSGVEWEYNNYLKGIDGRKEIEVDAHGNLHRVLREKKSRPGIDIILTIDARLQKKAEELLEGKRGAIICLNPQNGEILAMVSNPDYEPSVFAEKKKKEIETLVNRTDSPLLNRAIQGTYPPGSIFKVITAGAFLEENPGNEDITFICSGKIEMGRTFSCWERDGHGKINLLDAIAYSCDVYFYNLGLKTGVDRLSHYAMASGLGEKTGIDLPYEVKGFVPTRSWKERFFRIFSQKKWYPGETMVMAIGQGYLKVTPLQMALLYAAIANGGDIYRPHLVMTMEKDGKNFSISMPELAGRLPFKQTTLDVIKRGLYEVVHGHGGTGVNARMDKISAGGKTGTAQVIGSKNEDIPFIYRDHAWFCGFAPYEEPDIVVAILVEHGGSGAYAAAPLFKEIVEFYFANLND